MRRLHQALLHRTCEDYVDGIVPFLHAAVAAGEPALVAVPGAKVDVLRHCLDRASGRIGFLDMAEVGRNPGRIIPAIRQFGAAHAGRRVRFVGEPIWPGRSDAETREGVRHEALLNLAFAAAPVTILCPYDAARVSPAALVDAVATHPETVEDGTARPNPGSVPALAACASDGDLEGAEAARTVPFRRDDLPDVRRVVVAGAREAGLSPGRADDLLLAVNELARNTLRYSGSGAGTMRLWGHGDAVVCEVSDGGYIRDPLAGRHLPSLDADGGRGLWMVNQLGDLVELRSGPGGTTVRIRVEGP